jgi:hypothetical protein
MSENNLINTIIELGYIPLHDTYTNSDIYIYVSENIMPNIEILTEDHEVVGSIVITTCGIFNVKETPSEIFKMMYNSLFG